MQHFHMAFIEKHTSVELGVASAYTQAHTIENLVGYYYMAKNFLAML